MRIHIPDQVPVPLKSRQPHEKQTGELQLKLVETQELEGIQPALALAKKAQNPLPKTLVNSAAPSSLEATSPLLLLLDPKPI